MVSGYLWLWIGFNVLVLALLALDLGVFHRKAHVIGFKEAVVWSVIWVVVALVFNVVMFFYWGEQKPIQDQIRAVSYPTTRDVLIQNATATDARKDIVDLFERIPKQQYTSPENVEKEVANVIGLEFLTGYLIERSLSIDNIFVFLIIFSYFGVPRMHQYGVLMWGIIGALILRAIFIFAGVTLINMFHWIIYVFGAFLVITGIRMAFRQEEEIHPERNPILRLARWLLPVTPEYHGGKFFVRQGHKNFATPLFIVLLVVESTDLVFAVDSIPAILAITQDPFIVYSSNVFAILGLRALYFALAGFMEMFRYLHYGLAAVLIFVGVKMLLADIFHIPTSASLLIVVAILTVSVIASIVNPPEAPTIAPPTEIPPNKAGTDEGKK